MSGNFYQLNGTEDIYNCSYCCTLQVEKTSQKSFKFSKFMGKSVNWWATEGIMSKIFLITAACWWGKDCHRSGSRGNSCSIRINQRREPSCQRTKRRDKSGNYFTTRYSVLFYVWLLIPCCPLPLLEVKK